VAINYRHCRWNDIDCRCIFSFYKSSFHWHYYLLSCR